MRIVRKITMTLLIAAPLLFVAGYIRAFSTDPNNQPQTTATADRAIIDYINDLRVTKGLQPLKLDAQLSQSAKAKADDMAARNYFTHQSPDGEPFYVKPQATHPGLIQYGENLAECFTSNKQTFDAWVLSPSHYENMVKPEFNLFGTATIYDKDRSCLVTVNHFGGEGE